METHSKEFTFTTVELKNVIAVKKHFFMYISIYTILFFFIKYL